MWDYAGGCCCYEHNFLCRVCAQQNAGLLVLRGMTDNARTMVHMEGGELVDIETDSKE